MNRVIAGLVGLGVVGLAPVATTSAADAATAHHVAVGLVRAPAGPAARDAQPTRQIDSRMDQKSRRKIIFRGKVRGAPRYANKHITIERRIGKKGHWKVFARPLTSDFGNWHQRVGAPRRGKWYFRAVTPKDADYGTSYSSIWFTYTI